MDAFSLNEILLALLVVTFAGAVHGTFGLGFPMVATPVLALLSDVQTTILLTLAPNIAVNLWSMLRGGNLRESVGRFWYVAAWMLVGSSIGTLILVSLDPNPFRLLLALVILSYLMSARLERLDWSWIRRRPRISGSGAGLLAGLLGGMVNAGGPAVMIYFLEMRVPPLVLVQSLNLAFLIGKSTQATTFGVLGVLSLPLLLLSLPLGVLALVGLRSGMWLRDRFSADTYRGWLRALLWCLSVLLVVQFFRDL
ncbi:MAG: sulfite exporter TauE/SafE family protein [Chromatiales bacterium]|nr:sulfite exporter TauE/SafE family protein [Chromatiales bacterium]